MTFRKVVIAILLIAVISYAGVLGFYTLSKHAPFFMKVGPFTIGVHINSYWGPHLLHDWAYDAALTVVAWIGPQQGLSDEEVAELWIEL